MHEHKCSLFCSDEREEDQIHRNGALIGSGFFAINTFKDTLIKYALLAEFNVN
jgi:hypothetical protein